MPLLSNIPNELLESIFKYLHPDDVDNFSQSCKGFHNISARILPGHAHLKREYSRVFCGFLDDQKLVHPLLLFREIFKNSEIVWYVKEMYIGLCDDFCASMDKESWKEAGKIAMECKDDIVETVQACPYLDDEEREHWIKATLSCHQDTAVALLACMFPCLEGISITDNPFNEELHFLVRRIIEAKRLDPGGSHALSKLEIFQEENKTAGAFRDIISFEPFCSLPSMRRYVGRYLHHQLQWTPAEKKSRISSLQFSSCMIYPSTLRNIISSIESLEDFTYEYYWHNGWAIAWKPGQIILNLLEFAGSSLIELELTRKSSRIERLVEYARRYVEEDLQSFYGLPRKFNMFMGSLRGFQVLKYIRVHYEAFIEEDQEGSGRGRIVHGLVDILPASVVKVVLATPQLAETEMWRLTDDLPRFRAERLPRLKQIIFENGKDHKELKAVTIADGTQLLL